MKPYLKAISISIVIVSFLVSCKGVGIFSLIATTEKIDPGLLPKGLGVSGILQIDNEYPSTHYDYFSSGSALYRRDTTNRGESGNIRWSTISLPSGGWTNIQSIVASKNRLFLAVASSSGPGLSIGLFTYTNSAGYKLISDKDSIFASGGGYKKITLFYPNSDSTTQSLYVNVLEYSGTFGKDTTTFSGSKLYLIDDSATEITANDEQSSWEEPLKTSYIASAAYSGSSYRFTIIDPDTVTPTGKLVDNIGAVTEGIVLGTDGKASTDTSPPLPSGALTWLPNLNAYIMASRPTSGGSNIYISTDGAEGNDWRTLSSPYYLTCFLDVSNTRAGGKAPENTDDYSPPNILVLAGTRTTSSTSSGKGYLEIIVGDVKEPLTPEKWTLRTSNNSFTFSQSNSYKASDLSSTSISALTLLSESDSGEQYAYASTYNSGLWRINADDNSSLLANTLTWKAE